MNIWDFPKKIQDAVYGIAETVLCSKINLKHIWQGIISYDVSTLCVWFITFRFGQARLTIHSIYYIFTADCSVYISEEKQDVNRNNLSSKHKLFNLVSFTKLQKLI